jgi:hypothetical protein
MIASIRQGGVWLVEWRQFGNNTVTAGKSQSSKDKGLKQGKEMLVYCERTKNIL